MAKNPSDSRDFYHEPGSGLTAEVRLRPAWWRARAPVQMWVDPRGAWRFRYADGASRAMVPDHIDVGPGYRWLTLAGAGSMNDESGKRRWRLTLWAGSATPQDWRRVRMAALWHMQRMSPAHE